MSAIIDFWKTIVLPHVPYFIRHDFWRKLFALVFAGMLTVVAYQNADAKIEMEETDFRNVPVRFTTAEKGVTLTPYDISVAIRVEVPKKQKGFLKNTVYEKRVPGQPGTRFFFRLWVIQASSSASGCWRTAPAPGR